MTRKLRVLNLEDSERDSLLLHRHIERAGYSVLMERVDTAHGFRAALNREVWDVILSDYTIPQFGALPALAILKEYSNDIPFIILSGNVGEEIAVEAMRSGAHDYLMKGNLTRLIPAIEREIEEASNRRARRQAEMELLASQYQLARYAEELEAAHIETLERLARVIEFRDDETGQHTQRVGRTSALLAERLGFSEEYVRWIEQAARLHDIGKVGIPDLILMKVGRLTDAEFALMQTHTVIGSDLFEEGRSELIQIARRIAASHHERWDGLGYPQGLVGEEIPMEARILAVADVFDALTHDRPYKQAWSVAEALGEIQAQSGSQFDPAVVEAFLPLPHTTLV